MSINMLSETTRKIGVLNSGGDCAGLNTVIAAIVKYGVRLGYSFVGFEKGWEGLIVIGGDGTLAAAMQLSQHGVPIIGVPKSIDNDLSGTDLTFGFSTAVSVAVGALDKIHTTASSHERVFFVECMGRHAGWGTLHSGLAANANAILLPEFEFDLNG